MYRLTEPGKKYQVGSFCRYRLIPQIRKKEKGRERESKYETKHDLRKREKERAGKRENVKSKKERKERRKGKGQEEK